MTGRRGSCDPYQPEDQPRGDPERDAFPRPSWRGRSCGVGRLARNPTPLRSRAAIWKKVRRVLGSMTDSLQRFRGIRGNVGCAS
jgi:hypothetical protein